MEKSVSLRGMTVVSANYSPWATQAKVSNSVILKFILVLMIVQEAPAVNITLEEEDFSSIFFSQIKVSYVDLMHFGHSCLISTSGFFIHGDPY